MAFRGLTKKGADYLATRLANELAVEFLKVEIGDGAVVSGQNPKNQTSLISYKKDVRILKKEQENNAINLTIQITNDDITQGFYLKEIGIYVNDSSSNGCLYWYCNEDNAQYIPAKTDSVIAFEIDIRMEVTNSDATIINWSGKNTWINKEYLEENYTQNGGYKGTALEIDDRVVSALGKEDGKFPLNEAIQGNVYYFPANKKFYICKETQNRRISVPDVKFEELSIWENRKRLENLFSFNLIKTGQNKGYKFYTKASERTNYIDVSDTFLSVDFCIVSPYKEGISSNDARIVNFQEFKEGKILINSVWVKNGSIETKYSPNSSDSIITTSCIAFVYGSLK